MKIEKQDGRLQALNPNKILKRIKDQSKELNVDPYIIGQKVIASIIDGMTTKQVDELIATTSSNMIFDDPDYSLLASKILITRQSKILGVDAIDSDFNFDYFGIKSFFHKYSLRNEKGEPIELPHMMYKRVVNHVMKDFNTSERRKFYNELRYKKISIATPQLMNAGSKRRNGLMSCEIYTLVDDSTEGIQQTLNDIQQASRLGSGIGLHLHSLRSRHSLVSSFNDFAGGVVRFLDMVQSSMRFFKQGKRAGSCSPYLGIWHRDVEEFLEVTLPVGDEAMRLRDLFPAICIPDLFMERLNEDNGSMWSLFCPHDVKNAGYKALHQTWGEEFKELYKKLEEDNAVPRKEVSVKSLWSMILHSQAQSGRPYTWFWDNANKNNPEDNVGIRTGSNLCIEFYGISKENFASQCDLGLIPLHNLERNDFKEVSRRVKILTKWLNYVIDCNIWNTEAAANSGNKMRAIGIGIGGLADYMANHKINFDSEEAKEFNRELMKTIYDTAKKTSHDLAVNFYKKSYDKWEGSRYHKDNYEMSNSILLCLMPSASTSALMGITESFEPRESNLSVRRIDAGEFKLINKYLIRDLKEINLWNENIKNQLIINNGSVLNLVMPEEIKMRYRTIWEIKQKELINLAAIRQEFIDQGQSMNLYFSDATTGKIGGALNYAWKKGLPTGSYYVKTTSRLGNASRLAVSNNKAIKPDDSIFECYNCSS